MGLLSAGQVLLRASKGELSDVVATVGDRARGIACAAARFLSSRIARLESVSRHSRSPTMQVCFAGSGSTVATVATHVRVLLRFNERLLEAILGIETFATTTKPEDKQEIFEPKSSGPLC